MELPGKKSRLLARVELGADPQEAVKLQRQIKVYPLGKPNKFDPPVEITLFDNEAAAPRRGVQKKQGRCDPGERGVISTRGWKSATSRRRARLRSRRATSEELQRIDDVIVKAGGYRSFRRRCTTRGGTMRNGWLRPGTMRQLRQRLSDPLSDQLRRHLGEQYEGSRLLQDQRRRQRQAGRRFENTYTMTFPKGQKPGQPRAAISGRLSRWTPVKFQVIRKIRRKRIPAQQSGEVSPGPSDGSLTLYFAAKLPDGAPPQGTGCRRRRAWNYNLTFRFYGPTGDVAARTYFPPALQRMR